MAKELSVLQQQAEAIKTEVNKGANTSERVGGMLEDMLDYNEEQSKIDEGNTGVSEYPKFSEQEEYKSGEVVERNGKLYEFKVDHPAGSWNETHVEATSLKKIQDKKLTELSKTFLFCDSYQELENQQLISEYEDDKIISYDGNVIDYNYGFKVYTIKNLESLNKPIFIKYDFLLAEFITRTYLNVALYDENDNFLVGYAVSGTHIMQIPYGYTLKISADNNNPVIKGNRLLVGSITNDLEVIDCVGDSLSMAGVYASELQKLTGLSCVNLGVGGENTATILGRMNGIPYKIAEKVTIPSSKDTIQIKLTNIYNQRILPLLQGNKTIGITICGVEGILSTTQTDATAENADYFFERNTEGEQFTVEKGENIYITSNKLYQNPNRAKIIWVGQNGGFSINETGRYQGDFSNQEDRARYIAMLKTYINVANPTRYIVMSPPEFTTDDIENDLELEFGSCFINVRKEMINNGIQIAKIIGLLDSNYPTEDDLEDIGNNKIPRSLRSDNIHFNEIGYKVLAHIIYNKIYIIWNLDKLIVE
uniref:Hydrolase n=1 Tax=Siphoviridae sp. ctvuW5 TaxID=2825725 RepID=A0A8S5TX34_9CAUD|nr:MAG TPA: hydrolase [Siphoviridae sp. ctvuW5]